MTKKELLTKLEDYQTQLSKAAEKEDDMKNYIEHIEAMIDTLRIENNELRNQYNEVHKYLVERLDFEQSLVEMFIKVINDYQGN